MGFIDSFKRRRLVSKGLSSGKKRRTTAASESLVVNSIGKSIWGKLMIYPAFMVVSCLIVAFYVSENTLFYNDEMRRSLICLIISCIAVFFYHIRHSSEVRNGKVLLVFGGILIHMALVRSVYYFGDQNFRLLLVPLAFAPMVHSVLLGRYSGVFSALVVSLFGCLLVPVEDIFYYLLISLSAGGVAVSLTKNVRRRGSLLRAGLYVGIVVLLLALAFNKIKLDDFFTEDRITAEGTKILIALLGGVVTGMVVSGLLPILETLFTITTDISWLELSDLNHKILRKLQLEAPGTYHHSMVVATLSESAAEKVSANATMCRVCAYFHDIGKLKKPNYFIENQGDVNPHDDLTPTMSTIIIVAHVKDGVDMAIKHKLNPKIIDVIREHHGSSVMRFFYNKALELRKDAELKVEQGIENKEDLPEIDEKSFRYPGPTPSSRESGIISLADIVESASRSWKKPTPKKIAKNVHDLVMDRVISGQMNNSGLTLGEIHKIVESFTSTLTSMMHTRIDYPDVDTHGKNEVLPRSSEEKKK